MQVSRFRELRVYTLAFQSAVAVFEVTGALSEREKYGVTDRIWRASQSVCTDMAQASTGQTLRGKWADADAEARRSASGSRLTVMMPHPKQCMIVSS